MFQLGPQVTDWVEDSGRLMTPSDALRGINRGITLAQAFDDFALSWSVCAFFVPTDLRAVIGKRYVVRSLGACRGDQARLIAAMMGMAPCPAFDAMRKGMTVDLDELLKRVRSGAIKELTLSDVTLPDGTRIAQAQLDTPADAVMFGDLMERSRQVEPVEVTSARVAKRRDQVRDSSQSIVRHAPNALMLSKAMADHLSDLAGARLHQKTVLESRHTLRLFAGVIGEDIPVASLTQDHVRAFFEGATSPRPE